MKKRADFEVSRTNEDKKMEEEGDMDVAKTGTMNLLDWADKGKACARLSTPMPRLEKW